MPILKTDRDSQWTLERSGANYVLAEQATIRVDADYAIREASDNNRIVVNGDIVARGEAAAAIGIVGPGTVLTIAGTARIRLRSDLAHGIDAEAAGQHVENHGRVIGAHIGLFGAAWGYLDNHGTIAASTCIDYQMGGAQVRNYGRLDGVYGIEAQANGTFVLNARGATIDASRYGIWFQGAAGGGEIVNRGTIRSDDLAIADENAELRLVNHGRIVGDIYLGGGHDFVEMRGGTFQGTLDGGAGDDVYRIDIKSVTIFDTGTSTFDRLFATVSTRLGGGVEVLQLEGSRDLDGTGNDGGNFLFGNRGDNLLRGLGGDDLLSGAGGRDWLEGGAGADRFVFNRGDGVDTISDFEDGLDLIASDAVETEQDFLDLAIRRHGADTVIDFGGGSRLVIAGSLPEDIDYTDFVRP